MTATNQYETNDLNMVSVLIFLSVPFVTEMKGRSVWFLFENPERCRELEEQYLNGRLEIADARGLLNELASTKDLIYQKLRSNND